MNVADFIVDFLIDKGVTDVFGLPGGVVLDFLYALAAKEQKIAVHLTYHEQAAAFAACGYAQVNGKAGVAYATRGPGITNLVTAIADAYYDSIPVLFISAHSHVPNKNAMRIEMDQEMDPLPMLNGICKYATRIDHIDHVKQIIAYAYSQATTGRKGPVFLDFNSRLFKLNIAEDHNNLQEEEARNSSDLPSRAIESIKCSMKKAKRPVLLIGDGVRQAQCENYIKEIAEKAKLPVLSSRASQDIMPASRMYYGYIGSHGMRCANFILSKADLVIALGNRLSFPQSSKSFAPFLHHKKIIRIDVDEAEFFRHFSQSICFRLNLIDLLPGLSGAALAYGSLSEWISLCEHLKNTCAKYDQTSLIRGLSESLRCVSAESVITCDVGNNEFWVSRAYMLAGVENRILYSKSFGAMGCSLPKAIGAVYATKAPVICFAGDQGIQLNLQELQFIANQNLPIAVVILNNYASGMIRIKQKNAYQGIYVHTTLDSGYSVPDFSRLAAAYGIAYYRCENIEKENPGRYMRHIDGPRLIEVCVNQDEEILPTLPQNHPYQNLAPEMTEEEYKKIDAL